MISSTPPATSPTPTVNDVFTQAAPTTGAVAEPATTAPIESLPAPTLAASTPVETIVATPIETTEVATGVPGETATPWPSIPAATAEISEVFAPGQQDTATLNEDGFQSYPIIGIELQPLLVFVEPADTLDVAVAIYQGELVGEVASGDLTPLAQVDFSRTGGPEIMVFTPEEDDQYALVVSGQGTGEYTVYLFGVGAGATSGMLQDAAALMPGEAKSYTVQSNGGRPVLVWVAPQEPADLAFQVQDENGNVVQEANFSSQGAEAAFVLPLQTSRYTVIVSEASGASAAFNIAIITLE